MGSGLEDGKKPGEIQRMVFIPSIFFKLNIVSFRIFLTVRIFHCFWKVGCGRRGRDNHSGDLMPTTGFESLAESGVVWERSCRYSVGIIVDNVWVKVASANCTKIAKAIHCQNALAVYWEDIANELTTVVQLNFRAEWWWIVPSFPKAKRRLGVFSDPSHWLRGIALVDECCRRLYL